MPGATPVTDPLADPIFAKLFDAVHKPPDGVPINGVLLPVHTVLPPVIAVGAGFTVTTALAVHVFV